MTARRLSYIAYQAQIYEFGALVESRVSAFVGVRAGSGRIENSAVPSAALLAG